MLVAARRGFTLIELLVGLVLLGMAGAVMVRAALRMERGTGALLESTQLHGSFDATLDFLDADLADIGTDSLGADLVQISPDSLTWRATRGVGLACRIGLSGIWLLQDRWVAARLPQAGRDSLLLFVDGDSLPYASGGWQAFPVLGVSAGSCGSAPALRVASSIDSTLAGRTDLPALLPVRSFEVMQARLYQSAGRWWFGVRSVSAGEVIQPLAGPYTPGGVRLNYADSAALATSVPGAVRALRILLAGAAGGGRDSLGLSLAPRNLVP